ncbi:type 1 fimbrial protein [Pseudomonas nabeulensis]|uniref:Type 1 fimbrial protein n=1 Tax=Pseudomonas nabeulensis TaxID=2293833 RepID=A0A4Z0B722_9PSED|nr:fimbrial protein [Pseudomonas nabeulensis]TFY94219.1 type 1 fimbrial protein [Pseudomonas nabeulensis]
MNWRTVTLLVLSLLASRWGAAAGACTPAPVTLITVPPILNLPASPTVGQVLGNPDGYTFDVPNALTCTYDPSFVEYWFETSVPPETLTGGAYVTHYGVRMPIYFTGLRGVGFGVLAEDRDSGGLKSVTTGVTVLRGPMFPGLPTWGMRGRLFFFATGPISAGLISSRTVATVEVRGATGIHAVMLGNTVIGPPQKPTCSITTPSIAMDLGTVKASEFAGVGSAAGSVTNTIVLQCAGGSGANADVWVTLTDQTNPGNRGDHLSLTKSSTAQGIALQLLHGANVLRYGPDNSAVGTPNQWMAGSTDNGTFTIPLTARYVQTMPRISPGTANGVATFTLNYR